MTLQEIFNRYPITVTGFAKYIGKDRQWINSRLRSIANVKAGDAELISEGIRKLSKELRAVRLKRIVEK